MKKVLKIIGLIFVILLLLLLLLDIVIVVKSKTKPNDVPGVFGYKPFIVMSGSMLTKIDIGDLVFVKEVDPNSLKVNDIIAFRDAKNTVTTHRIINIIDSNGKLSFETKGDSNNIKDEKMVTPERIEGIYKFKISKLGKFILYIQEPSGFSVMILIILVVGAFMFIFESRNDNNSENENKKDKKEKEDRKKEKTKKEKIKNEIIDEEYRKEFEEFKEFQKFKRQEEERKKLEEERKQQGD